MKIKHATDIPAHPFITTDDEHDGIATCIEGTKAAGTTWTIPHDLGRIPTGVEITRKDKACDVYVYSRNGVEQITDTTVTVAFTATNAKVYLRIY
jgi:hypothetical protein